MTLQSNLGQWLSDRAGYCTASRVKDAIGRTKDGKRYKSERRNYMMQLVAERCEGVADSSYVTKAMRDGIEREPYAVEMFEAVYGVKCGPAAFVAHPKIEFFGATPDGFIGSDALLEVKCPTLLTYLRWVLEGGVPEEHVDQLITQQLCTGRRRTVFCAYHPDAPPGMQMFVRPFVSTAEQRDHVVAEVKKFLLETDKMFDDFTSTEFKPEISWIQKSLDELWNQKNQEPVAKPPTIATE